MRGPDEVELRIVALSLSQARQKALPIPCHKLRGQLDDVQLLPGDPFRQPHRVELRLGWHQHLGRRRDAEGCRVVGLRIGAISRCGGVGWELLAILGLRRGGGGGVGGRRLGGELGDAVLVVGVVGVGGLEEVDHGVAPVEGDDAALELGTVLGDEGGRLLDNHADVGRGKDDADGACMGGDRGRRLGLGGGGAGGRGRHLLLLLVVAVAVRRGEEEHGGHHRGSHGERWRWSLGFRPQMEVDRKGWGRTCRPWDARRLEGLQLGRVRAACGPAGANS